MLLFPLQNRQNAFGAIQPPGYLLFLEEEGEKLRAEQTFEEFTRTHGQKSVINTHSGLNTHSLGWFSNKLHPGNKSEL